MAKGLKTNSQVNTKETANICGTSKQSSKNSSLNTITSSNITCSQRTPTQLHASIENPWNNDKRKSMNYEHSLWY